MTTKTSLPLDGLRVAVTRVRAGPDEDRLSTLLRERGAHPVHLPTTEILPPDDPEPLRGAAERIHSYAWLVVTSARAVKPFVAALDAASYSTGELRAAGVRVCAVGERTGAALTAVGLPPALIPERFVAEGVVEALLAGEGVKGLRILLPRAQEAREVIPQELEAAGATVDVVPAYRTVPRPAEAARLAEMTALGEIGALTFTAGSSVRSFAEAWRARGGDGAAPGPGLIALGPATAAALEEEGLRVDGSADPHTLEGLVKAVEGWARSRPGRP